MEFTWSYDLNGGRTTGRTVPWLVLGRHWLSFIQLDAGTVWHTLKMKLVKGDLPFWHGLSIVLGTIRHLPLHGLLLFLAFTVFRP